MLLPSDYLQVGDGICCKWQLRSEKHTFYVFLCISGRKSVWVLIMNHSEPFDRSVGGGNAAIRRWIIVFLVADCETTKWRWQMSPATRSFGGNGVELAMTGVSMA